MKEALIFSIIVAGCFTTIIQTLEKWNFSEWFKVRTKINVCYFCISFWISIALAIIFFYFSPGINYWSFLCPLIIPALTSFFHNSPIKGL